MISTRGRYAIRLLIDLAEQEQDGYVPLRDTAARQGISKKYLESIVGDLVRGGFVTGVSGKGGGYRLCRPPKECNIGEVLTYIEGTLATVACLREGAIPCPRAGFCETLPMWKEFDSLVHDFFYGRTIADLMQKDPPDGRKKALSDKKEAPQQKADEKKLTEVLQPDT